LKKNDKTHPFCNHFALGTSLRNRVKKQQHPFLESFRRQQKPFQKLIKEISVIFHTLPWKITIFPWGLLIEQAQKRQRAAASAGSVVKD
jgi:hypothetical protein